MESSASSKIDLSDWERVSIEIEQWNISVRQYEDLVYLSCLLQLIPISAIVQPSSGTPDSLEVSNERILEGGRGKLKKTNFHTM